VTADRRIFVTGASGVIGSAVLAELGSDGVLCLRHRTELPVPAAAQREGDLRRPRMGMSRETFRALAREVDGVLHIGAETRWGSDPAEIERTNRIGTEAALELAALADAPLHYVSTAFVPMAADRGDGGTGADDALDLERGLDAYLASKAAADAAVLASGVPGTVVRPSYVIGDSRSGRIARFQGLYRIVSLAVRNLIPAVPVPPAAITDFVPQDVVARTIAAVVRADAREGELWITAGERALRAGEFLDLAVELAQRLGLDVHRPRLMSPDVVDRLIRPVFVARLPHEARKLFDDMIAMTSLLGRASTLPSSLEQVERRFGVDVGYEPRAALERSLVYWAQQKGLARA
jgi:nucleoside-diphosphate-sugar epimerase